MRETFVTIALILAGCGLWYACYLLSLPSYKLGDNHIGGVMIGFMSLGCLVGGFFCFIMVIIGLLKNGRIPP